MAATTRLLPGGASLSTPGRHMRTSAALLLVTAAAVVCVSLRSFSWQPSAAERAQLDAPVAQGRGARASGLMVPASAQLVTKGPASLSQLAARRRVRTVSPELARKEDSTPQARKEWADIDNIVGYMNAENSAFQQLAEDKKGSKGKKEENGCCNDVMDSSIHNDGYFLSGNSLKGGSNVIIYGTGSKVVHSGGGVANGGAIGPNGGMGGGGKGGKSGSGKK